MRKTKTGGRTMRRKGFTLIELMIVVAIIAILASIAIPQYKKFQLKAKTSEAKSNIGAIRSAEETYAAEHDVYKVIPNVPDNVPGAQAADWTSSTNGGVGFDDIGFKPAGKVYYTYWVVAGDGAANPPSDTSSTTATDNTDITIVAEGDLDANGGHGQNPQLNAEDGVFHATDENPKIVDDHPGKF